MQLMDVLPGSVRWTALMQQKALRGLTSSNPISVSQGSLAAMQLHVGEQVQEARFNGGRAMPAMKAWDPSLEPEVFMARLGALESNPIAGGVWGLAKYSGASDRGADILATTAGAGFAILTAAGAARGTGKTVGRSWVPNKVGPSAEDVNFFKDEDLSLRTEWTPDIRNGRTPFGNSVRHWNDHGPEFPELNSYNEYIQATQDFLNNPPAGTQSFMRTNGDVMRYDLATNTFGVLRADGQPRTMFRPSSPDYWQLQLKKYGGQ